MRGFILGGFVFIILTFVIFSINEINRGYAPRYDMLWTIAALVVYIFLDEKAASKLFNNLRLYIDDDRIVQEYVNILGQSKTEVVLFSEIKLIKLKKISTENGLVITINNGKNEIIDEVAEGYKLVVDIYERAKNYNTDMDRKLRNRAVEIKQIIRNLEKEKAKRQVIIRKKKTVSIIAFIIILLVLSVCSYYYWSYLYFLVAFSFYFLFFLVPRFKYPYDLD